MLRDYCINLSLVIAVAASVSLTGGCTALPAGLPGLAPAVSPAASPRASIKSAVRDLQQLQALNQLAALGGAGTVTAPTSSSHYAISDIATAAVNPGDLTDYNAHSGWDSGNNHWAFVAETGWYEVGDNARRTYQGTETITDAANHVLEASLKQSSWISGAYVGPDDWSGSDVSTEWVTASSVRPAGTYVRERDSARSSLPASGSLDAATESLHFSPADGGDPIITRIVRNESASGDGVHQKTSLQTGSLPGGVTFSCQGATTMSASTFLMASDDALTLNDARQVQARLRISGEPDTAGHGPKNLAAGSLLGVTLVGADGATLVSLLADRLTLDAATQLVDTLGSVSDASNTPVATFAGTFDIVHSTWRGTVTYSDGTTDTLNLDAVAQSITN